MKKLKKKEIKTIIEVADEILTALAGKNEDVNPDDSTKMCQLWDDLNDRFAPPEVVKALCLEVLELRKKRDQQAPVAWMIYTPKVDVTYVELNQKAAERVLAGCIKDGIEVIITPLCVQVNDV